MEGLLNIFSHLSAFVNGMEFYFYFVLMSFFTSFINIVLVVAAPVNLILEHCFTVSVWSLYLPAPQCHRRLSGAGRLVKRKFGILSLVLDTM